jgi:PAS domain S-box-containing protein
MTDFRKTLLRYGIAVFGIAAAVFVRRLVAPAMGPDAPYITVYPTVMFIAVLLGPGPGLVAGALGVLAAQIWLIEPIGVFKITLADSWRAAFVFMSAAYLGYVGKKIRETENRNRRLVEDSPDAIVLHDGRTYVFVNSAAVQMFGAGGPRELIGRAVYSIIRPDFHEIVRERILMMGRTGVTSPPRELKMLRLDGSEIDVESRGTSVFLEGKRVFQIVFRDITERKKAEQALREKTLQLEDLTRNLEQKVRDEIVIRTKNEQMLIQQSKLAAMGELLGAIAHQWRQPLNVVGLIVQNMQEVHEKGKLDGNYIDKSVQKAMMHVEHMSKTIDDFRNFYKPDKEKKVFDAMRAVGDVLNLLSAQLASDNIKYRLTCHTHGKIFENEADIVICAEKAVEGFKNEFEHVVLNLINNARDAIIERRMRGETAPSHKGLLSFDFYNTNSAVTIEISDNGGGIPSEMIDRIFHPYFTTKEKTKGTGLGLYMSKVIVEDHMSGKLSVGNNGHGAIFTIKLPYPGTELHHENAAALRDLHPLTRK